MHVIMQQAVPTISKEGEHFQLRFDLGHDSFTVLMTPVALQALGLQCIALVPATAPEMSSKSVGDAVRQPAHLLKKLDDRSIQILLRESQLDTLIDFLWYMKDAELLKLILRNMSQHAAEMLMEDIDQSWHGKNPDNTLDANAKRGREAVVTTIATVRRLIAEGHIADVLGKAQEAGT